MASVVIIHAAEDALPARALAEKLRGAKLNPVLEKYGEEARNAAKGAKVSIALWSPRSANQAEMIDDVEAVRAKGKVLHARMQNTMPPPKFSSDPSFDLTGWRGEDDFRPWRELAEEIASKAGVGPLPPPTPRPPGGFFQPGRVGEPGAAPAPRPGAAPRAQQQQRAPQQQRAAAPPPRATQAPRAAEPERAKGGGPMLLIIIAVLVLGGGGAGAWWYMNQQQSASTTAAAWDDVPQNDASAIRAFLAGAPGEYRDDAEQALATLEQQTFDAAQEADTIEAFEAFVRDFPESDNALAARGRIAELRAMPPPVTEEVPLVPGETSPDLLPPGAATPDPNAPVTLSPADPPAAPADPAPAPATP